MFKVFILFFCILGNKVLDVIVQGQSVTNPKFIVFIDHITEFSIRSFFILVFYFIL